MHAHSTSQTFIADPKDQEILRLQLALLEAQNQVEAANSRYQYMLEFFMGGEDLNLFSSHSTDEDNEGPRARLTTSRPMQGIASPNTTEVNEDNHHLAHRI